MTGGERVLLRPPEPSWRVLDEDDPLSASTVALDKHHLRIARACTPERTEVVSDVVSRVAVRMGLRESRALPYILVGLFLEEWHGLAHYVGQGHLSFEHVRAIADCVECVPEEHRPSVEEDMLARLQPKRPCQATLTVTRLRQIAREVIDKHHPPARPKEDQPLPPGPPPEVQEPELNWNSSKPEFTDFFLRLNKIDSTELVQAIQYVATHDGCTRGEALMRLVRGQTTAEVTLNIYRPVNAGASAGATSAQQWEEGSIHAADQWLSAMVGAQWMERVTHIAAPGYDKGEGYHPTPSIRASVMGRDGHCRFPGCEVPAERCDLDHVHRWDHEAPQGGCSETSTANLHCLCRKHHRMKTAGQWDVTLHPDGTETWTSHGDGHTVTTEPGGVLGRETFEHFAVRRTKNLANYNTERARREDWVQLVANLAREEANKGKHLGYIWGFRDVEKIATERARLLVTYPNNGLQQEEAIPF